MQITYAHKTRKVVLMKRRLRGLYYRRAAQLIANQIKSAVDHRMCRTALKRSPHLVQAVFDRDERDKEQVDLFLETRAAQAKTRRSKQIQMWRQRTGITDTNIVPDHVYTPITGATSYVPVEGALKPTGQSVIKNSSTRANRPSSYAFTEGSGEIV